MRRFIPSLISLALFSGMFFTSFKKGDPAPLGARTNAKFLAGEKGKNKSWKLREFPVQYGSNAATMEGTRIIQPESKRLTIIT